MGPLVAAIWGWDERVQRDFHERVFDSARWQIIVADGADIGMLDVEYRAAEVYLARIEIHPDHQGRGIGGHLVTTLLKDAARRGQDLVLDVFAVNHRAYELYRRLGLREVARYDEGGIKITMRSTRT